MTVTARWVVAPLTLVAILLIAGRAPHSGWAWRGLVAGLLAVAAYDAVRLPMVFLGWWPDFIPRLGGWVLGIDGPNAVVGYAWRYVGDGGGMGVVFFGTCTALAMVWPALLNRHSFSLAIGYGVFVWFGLVGTIALSARGSGMLFVLTGTSLTLSLLGHLIYGAVLGICLRYMTARRQELGAISPDQPRTPTTIDDARSR